MTHKMIPYFRENLMAVSPAETRLNFEITPVNRVDMPNRMENFLSGYLYDWVQEAIPWVELPPQETICSIVDLPKLDESTEFYVPVLGGVHGAPRYHIPSCNRELSFLKVTYKGDSGSHIFLSEAGRPIREREAG